MNEQFIGKKLSVIVPVCERTESAASLYHEYKQSCQGLCDEVEFIYVVNTHHPEVITDLRQINKEDPDLNLVILNRDYGEATAVQAGFNQCSGDFILTLPPYKQVNSDELVKLFEQLDDYDIALGKRWPRVDGSANQLQTRLFNFLLKKFSDLDFSDIGCGVRLIRAEVLEETHVYGDQWRFLPLLAYQLGFMSTEVELSQATEDSYSRIYKPGLYLRRVLDMITIVFLTKFNKKPLRFFGLVGSSAIVISAIGLAYLAIDRLAFGVGVSDRPLLVLFSIFMVLGCQLIAIGLVGETLIFTHAKNNREYRIREILQIPKK